MRKAGLFHLCTKHSFIEEKLCLQKIRLCVQVEYFTLDNYILILLVSGSSTRFEEDMDEMMLKK